MISGLAIWGLRFLDGITVLKTEFLEPIAGLSETMMDKQMKNLKNAF